MKLRVFRPTGTRDVLRWRVGPFDWTISAVGWSRAEGASRDWPVVGRGFRLHCLQGGGSARFDTPAECEAHAIRIVRAYANAMLDACHEHAQPGPRLVPDVRSEEPGYPVYFVSAQARELEELRSAAYDRVAAGFQVTWVSSANVRHRAHLRENRPEFASRRWTVQTDDGRVTHVTHQEVLNMLATAIAIGEAS